MTDLSPQFRAAAQSAANRFGATLARDGVLTEGLDESAKELSKPWVEDAGDAFEMRQRCARFDEQY